MKRTTVSLEDCEAQRERPWFVPVCCYGDMRPEANELGGIFKGAARFQIVRGMMTYEARCVERIFVEARP